MASVQPITFGQLLRRYRRAARLTQEALAARAGVAVRSLSDLERDISRFPRAETIRLLVAALGLAGYARAAFEAAASRQGVPSLGATTAPTAFTTSDTPTFADRVEELAILKRHLDPADDRGPRPTLLLIAGEPGIGKSRLLAEAATQARGLGWRVLSGGCVRHSGQLPYDPFASVLSRALAESSLAQQRADLVGCGWLARLLPELLDTAVAPTPTWKLPPEQERRLMFAAVARYLTNVSGPAGTLLLLDDLQWVGADALDLLESLVRGAGRPSLRITGAYRSTEVDTRRPLALFLSDLARDGVVTQIPLGPLAAHDAEALLDAALSERTPQDDADALAGVTYAQRQRLLRRADGVPFFLVSGARALSTTKARRERDRTSDETHETPDIDTVSPRPEAPWTVSQSIRVRVAALPDAARTLMGIAAIAGRAAPGQLLMTLMGRAHYDEDEALDALDALREAGLLIEQDEDTFHITHDLIREVIESDLGTRRRRTLHLKIADELAHAPGEPPVEQVAYHYAQAGEAASAATWLERAGARASARYAYADAEVLYRKLASSLEDLARPLDAARIREMLGKTLNMQLKHDEAIATLEQAVQYYGRLGDLEGAARATAAIGRSLALQGSYDEGIRRLTAALEPITSLGPSHGAVAAYLTLNLLYWVAARHTSQAKVAACALEVARALHDSELRATAEAFYGIALVMLGRPLEALTLLHSALPYLEHAGDAEDVGYVLCQMGEAYLYQGQFDQARSCFTSAQEIARLLHPIAESYVDYLHGALAFYTGDWMAARERMERGYARAVESGNVAALSYPRFGLGQVELAEGKSDLANQHLEEALELARQGLPLRLLPLAQRCLAERDLLADRPETAIGRIESVFAAEEGRDSVDATALLPFLAWAYMRVERREKADHVIREALQRARTERHQLALLDALRVLAQLALDSRNWREAEDATAEGITLARSISYPYAEAKALYVSGHLHAAKGDLEQAHEQYQGARAICDRLGEGLYRPYIEQALAAME